MKGALGANAPAVSEIGENLQIYCYKTKSKHIFLGRKVYLKVLRKAQGNELSRVFEFCEEFLKVRPSSFQNQLSESASALDNNHCMRVSFRVLQHKRVY